MGSVFAKQRLRRASVQGVLRVYARPEKMLMRVVSVYDGDTITVLTRGIRGRYVLWNCRMMGYDAPEMRTRDEEEKGAAIRARDYMRSVLPTGYVFLGGVRGLDKYGRLLLWYVHDGEPLAELMVRQGLAVPYDGGRKQPFRREKGS